MAKKANGDRHKTKMFPIRMHPVLRTQLEKLAERKLTTLTAEVVEAIRRHLEANGLWPVDQAKK
jgi:predicted DNA-binding protein